MRERQGFFPYIVIYILCLISSMFNYGDFEVMSFAASLPLLDAIVIFYFAAYRNLISIWLILLMGFIADSMAGSILGVTSLSYILVVKLFQMIEVKKVSAEEFVYVIKKFLLFVSGFLLLKTFILMLIDDLTIDFVYILLQIVISASFYVLCHKVFDDFYRKYFYEK